MKEFSFSEPYLQVKFVESGESIQIDTPTVVMNLSMPSLAVGEETLLSRTSSLFSDVSLSNVDQAILISSEHGFSALNQYPSRDELMKKWSHVHEIFPLPHLANTHLWRSPKEQIGNVSFNLWFAEEGTDCGLHNEHDFLEVHTQVWGTGHMQKFHEKDEATMYQDIYMTPGYTHEPFCGSDHQYPWHRYIADTDCIWLAVEFN